MRIYKKEKRSYRVYRLDRVVYYLITAPIHLFLAEVSPREIPLTLT